MAHTAALLETFLEQLNSPEVVQAARSEAGALDDVQLAEQLKSSLSAFQARRTAQLQRLRHEAEKARGIPAARRGKGLAAEVALARGDSPARGTQHLRVATMLTQDMPNTLTALSDGRIREEHAQGITKETEWLTPHKRRTVDASIANTFEGNGPRKLSNIARELAQRLDHKTAAKQHAEAEAKRRIFVKPADNSMGQVTAILPMQQAVAVYESLRDAAKSLQSTGNSADAHGTKRTRDQIMADLLVERATGQATAAAVPAQIHVVMTDAALFGEGQEPAWLAGHGPIPASAAKAWLANPEVVAFLRRIFTRPKKKQLVAMDTQSQVFPQGLRLMVILRDDTCRVPFCDAKISDTDHITAKKDGGETSWENASGLCGACNQTKENTGWRHTGDPDSLTVKTPTDHTYTRTTRSLQPADPSSTNTAQIESTGDPPGEAPSRDGPTRFDTAPRRCTTAGVITMPIDRLDEAA